MYSEAKTLSCICFDTCVVKDDAFIQITVLSLNMRQHNTAIDNNIKQLNFFDRNKSELLSHYSYNIITL